MTNAIPCAAALLTVCREVIDSYRASSAGGSAVAGAERGPMLPELAELQYIEALVVSQATMPTAGVPAEWMQPGAFPRLRE